MKYKIILFLSFFILVSGVFGENVSVELVPSNISANVGDTINLNLVVKNVPENLKCEGFETYIYYNSSMLSISKNDVVLKDVSGSISRKDITISNGKIWILLWFSKDFSGNFTIATLSFKALNGGTGNVSLYKTVVSDANGNHIQNNPNILLVLKNSNISINSTNIPKPTSNLIISNFEYNKSLNGNLIIDNITSPINNISGTITLDNVELSESKNIIPNIPCNVFNSYKTTNKKLYSGLLFYGEHNYDSTYLTKYEIKNIDLIGYNIKNKITHISGCICVKNKNESIPIFLNISNYNGTVKNIYKNGKLICTYLYFNKSLNSDGSFKITSFKISERLINDGFSYSDDNYISLINLTAYSNNKKIILPTKEFKVTLYDIKQAKNEGVFFYPDNPSNSITDISYGDLKKIVLLITNNDKDISNISGTIFINQSLFDVNYSLSPEISHNVNYNISNISLNNNKLYFNISFNKPIPNKNTKTPIIVLTVSPKSNKNASTSIYLENISPKMDTKRLKVQIFERDISKLPPYYSGKTINYSFYIVPDKEYQNKYKLNILKIPLKFSKLQHNISLDVLLNGNIATNSAVVYSKKNNSNNNPKLFNAVRFYVDYDYDIGNITLGHSRTVELYLYRVSKNITNISGKIFINKSLFDVSDYGIPKDSDIYDKINTSNITLNNSNLYFNISLINGTNGTFSILKFKISSKVDKNISSTIYLENLSVYANNTKINLTVKNLTIDIIKRKINHPPKLKMAYNIFNNNEVHFYALSYDRDNDDLKYMWDFGDGENSTDENPIHRYSNYSTYKVKCTVKDPLNGTDEVVSIIEIKKYDVVNYSFSKDSFLSDDNKNKTVYINMTLKNPLTRNVGAYISFLDYNDYTPLKTQYEITLKPNETKKLIIPINVSKSCNINWNIIYYPAIKNNGKYNVEMGYYQWNFEKKIEFTSKPKVKVNNYTKIIKLNNTKVVLKVNKVKTVKNYVINKTITSSDNYMAPYYSFVSLFGFMIGLILIRFKIK